MTAIRDLLIAGPLVLLIMLALFPDEQQPEKAGPVIHYPGYLAPSIGGCK